MSTVVVFQENGARVIEGVNGRDFKRFPNVVIDPQELPHGVPPHHWKLVNGKIEEMSDSEKKIVDGDAPEEFKGNEIHLIQFTHRHYLRMFMVCGACSAVFSLIASWLFR